MVYEQEKIIAPLAKRWNLNHQAAQTGQEIGAEATLVGLALKIGTRGYNDPYINR